MRFVAGILADIAIWLSGLVDNIVRNCHMQNEQWFLDFQDMLNEISVR